MRTSPWYGVATASVRTATSAGSSLGSTGITLRSGTNTWLANAPSYSTPIRRTLRHMLTRPALHIRHDPQCSM